MSQHVVSRTAHISAVLLLAAGSTVVSQAATGATDHSALRRGTAGTSTNWSGYDVTAGGYTRVTASWVQPSVTCSGKKNAYSSFWVGLDGDGSSSVEQTGTDADCSRGRPAYYGWYEMYPAAPVNFTNPVSPGDTITATVTSDGAGNFTLLLTDGTKWTRTVTRSLTTAQLQSAEVIAEAPSSGRGVLPLANFGSVTFTGAQVNGTPIGSLNPNQITMAASGIVKAQPGPLSPDGQQFRVAWAHS
ncbi:hypothetical protein Back2_01770 [Nocardioides baekrokdamisoli]|uniref:Peptidase A4 family protein n=1 Tax=Nocardioides baekrokdamisoli TaxID=1804624 RepID=A0A3G9IAW1_9ACTN|nr:G1 family glutamic endopeptidase [Nocardioides baekrokdamisoli]BBH15890.1 hypothetical protein Back2_01770 [Nocardioides baekrokdamisoli]